MSTTEPIIIPINGDSSDFTADAKKVNAALDSMTAHTKTAGTATATAFNKAKMSVTDFRSSYQVAVDVLRVGQQVIQQTVNIAQQYDQSVRDMMLSTGGTADETSRLIQVVDDAGVSYATLKTALKIASREGIEPNIASLSALSDEYLKLAPGVERNQFLMQKFGRGGLEMARAMELGGDALRKMSAEMGGGLVLTQANIDASEKFRKTLDNLEDTANGVKIAMGNNFIPVLDDSLKVVTADVQGFGALVDVFKQLDNIMKIYPTGAERAARAQKLFADAAADAINSNLPSFMEDTSKQTDSATQSYIAMAQAMGTAADSIDEIIRSNEDELSIIFQLSDAYKQNAEEHAKRTQKILLDMTLEKIAMLDGEQGFNDAEMAKALAVAETAGAVEAAAIREMIAMEGLSTAIANSTIKAEDMKGILESITSHGWTVQVAIQMQNLENLRNTLSANAAANPGRSYNTPGRASGGPVSSNQMYMVGERGPELFVPSQSGNIIPNNKSGGMAGVIDAIERNRVSEERLVQLFENAVLRVMK